MSIYRSRNYYIAKANALAIFPLVLIVLPSGSFDKGTDICLFTLLSGIHCWGCGMTRACMHLIHLEYLAAWQYNKMVYIVLPILCGLLLAEFWKTIKKIKSFDKIPSSESETNDLTDS